MPKEDLRWRKLVVNLALGVCKHINTVFNFSL